MGTATIRTDSYNFNFLKLDWDLKEKYYDRAKYVEDFFVNGEFDSVIEQGEKYLRTDFPKVFNSYEKRADENDSVETRALYLLRIIFMALVSVAENSGQKVNTEFRNPLPEELFETTSRKLIYVQTANNESGNWSVYDGSEKIGDASAEIQKNPLALLPNSAYLRTQANLRIKKYMSTSGVPFVLDWAELAYRENNKQNPWFRDYDVHRVLERSGFNKNTDIDGNEWWNVTLDQAKQAIQAVKENRESIDGPEIDTAAIKFRPEQKTAVEQTKKAFKSHDRMLWNAKMRFGKTLSTYKLILESEFNKVLILTHRPVVSDSWAEDFNKLEMKKSGYRFGSKTGRSIESFIKDNKEKFIYFASIQDLRESERVGGKYSKNNEIFDTQWDLVVFDEAHEGTQTDLAQNVEKAVVKEKTKVLELSGTPFNLLDKFTDEQVFTWDYVMEQEAKLRWETERPNEPNPYETLPKVNMFTFEMGNKERYADDNKAFNFKEFFRVADDGKFVHETDVNNFLNEITTPSDTNYPYSTDRFREELRHTLWLLPGVSEARALKALMDKHSVFGKEYTIINVVDNNNDEVASQADLDRVRNAITDEPWNTKTITLTVRKLTTGVNVKEWTAVMFLNNTTSAMNYLQAAFRAQTPYSNAIQGQKTNSYIFDFAPDRALTVMAESASINSGVGKRNTPEQKQKMAQMLNFLPIVGMTGNSMEPFSVGEMLTQLKKVYAEKAVRSGFDDDSLYNDQLLTIDERASDLFKKLQGIVGKTGAAKKTNSVEISDNGLTDEELEKIEKAKKKKQRALTEEEKALREKLKEAKKQRKNAISILRGISIRIPLMIFGMQVDPAKDVDIDTFINEVDDMSWEEFMPKGVTKLMFKEQAKYYDSEVFIEAGRIIRSRAKSFDSLPYLERVEEIAALHSTFKNPDKETVLTPWRVVNMQMASTLGGLSFWNESYSKTHDEKGYRIRRWVNTPGVDKVFGLNSRVLEVNSKTGLYPLYVAASMFQKRYEEINDGRIMAPMEEAIIRRILKNNIFVIAKTPMAKTITQRTLAGYTGWETNITFIDGLTDLLKSDIKNGVVKVNEEFGNMKFDAVVGNPPYQANDNGQREDGSGNASASPLYHLFEELSEKISDRQSLIFPARWLSGAGKGLSEFSKRMLSDNHLKRIEVFYDSSEVFPSAEIKGGVLFIDRDDDYEGVPEVVIHRAGDINRSKRPLKDAVSGTFIPFVELANILEKVDRKTPDLKQNNIQKIVSVLKPYGLRTDFLKNQKKYALPETVFADARAAGENPIGVIGLAPGNKRVVRFLPSDYPVPTGADTIQSFKVFLPYAYGSGEFGETIPNPFIGDPGQIVTETFLRIGNFETRSEADNLLKYIKTKFFRALVGVLKITQHSTTTYGFVPLQDFKSDSDIDWSKSVEEIDQQLFEKYELDDDEVAFVKTQVKTM